MTPVTPVTPVTPARWRSSFWSLAGSFAVLLSFVTVPTPLYSLYEARDGFGTFTVTLVFAAYGVGVILGLFLIGHVSDHVGRRPVLLGVVAVELVCAALFPVLKGEAGLLALRALSGVGIGALTPTVTAQLGEAYDAWRPDSDGRLGRTISTAVNTGGLAVGPLAAGLLALLPAPLELPYLVYAGLILVVGVVLWRVPETVSAERRAEQWRYHPQRARVDPGARAAFTAAAVAALACFAALGFFTSLTGRFLTDTLGVTSRVEVGGVVTGLLLGTVVSQLALMRLGERRRLQVGAVLVAVGMAVIAVSALAASLVLFVVGGFVAAGGIGLVFAASVAVTGRIAAPERRGETLAALFLAAYVGITVPVVAIGVALTFAGTVPVLVVFSALVFLAVPSGVFALVRQVD